jgi:hypothetical protein
MLELSENKEVVLVESGKEHFSYVDRESNYAYTFSKDKIDDIIDFLISIKNNR